MVGKRFFVGEVTHEEWSNDSLRFITGRMDTLVAVSGTEVLFATAGTGEYDNNVVYYNRVKLALTHDTGSHIMWRCSELKPLFFAHPPEDYEKNIYVGGCLRCLLAACRTLTSNPRCAWILHTPWVSALISKTTTSWTLKTRKKKSLLAW